MIRFMEGILLRKAAEDVARVLSGAGHTVYFVGGCVRDRLLGYSVKDIDIATSARPDEVLRLFPDAWEVGAAFGVVLVRREGFSFEVATFRRDGSYRDGRRPEDVCFTDAEEDARRRDFTMNGLFEDPFSSPPGRVVDYVGGVEDIRARVLRCIGEPDRRFEEDSLRLMRAVRLPLLGKFRWRRRLAPPFSGTLRCWPGFPRNASGRNWTGFYCLPEGNGVWKCWWKRG